jgi:preprotein translocase subunit SecF
VNLRNAVATFRGHRQPHFDFIGRTRWWFALSGTFIVLSLIGLFVRGLNYSIDFEGGAQLRYPNDTAASVADVKGVLAKYGRADAEVQVVGTGAGQSEIVIRTRSLNDLGGPPQVRFTLPAKDATVDDLREALAESGILQPRIKVAAGKATVLIPQGALGASDDVTLVYRPDPSKKLDEAAVQKTLTSLGRSKASVTIIGGTVVVKMQPLDRPAPTPSPSPSASGSPQPSPSSTGAASPEPSASASSTGAAVTPAAAAAAPSKQPSAKPSAKAGGPPSPKPSSKPSPSVAPSASGSAAPSPSPTPAAPPTPREILDALAKQAGVSSSDITVNDLSKVTQHALVVALADRAGVEPGQVQPKEIGGDERARLLAELAEQGGIPTTEIVIKDVGPTWGAQISKKALQGLIIFLVLVTLYISFRFEWKMAGSALTALAHDLIITGGIYALVGREVTPETVIAILTILGYSLYDTVVIFDRVKENTESVALVAREGYSGVVNLSLNETLMRSVNTSLVVLFPILALLFFGGDTLKDFAFALFIGVTSGAYSSIFVASPMLALLKEREPRYTQMRLRAARAASRGQAQAPAAAPSGRPLRAVGSGGRRTTPGSSATAATSAAKSGEGALGDGDGAAAEPPKPAARAGQARSGSGGRPSGSRPGGGGGRSKSKKRTPPAKRRRR